MAAGTAVPVAAEAAQTAWRWAIAAELPISMASSLTIVGGNIKIVQLPTLMPNRNVQRFAPSNATLGGAWY